MNEHRLKDDRCVHLRCLDCGEIYHGETTRNFLRVAERHIISDHRELLPDDPTWSVGQMMEAIMDKIYVQKCFSWEGVE